MENLIDFNVFLKFTIEEGKRLLTLRILKGEENQLKSQNMQFMTKRFPCTSHYSTFIQA